MSSFTQLTTLHVDRFTMTRGTFVPSYTHTRSTTTTTALSQDQLYIPVLPPVLPSGASHAVSPVALL